MTDSFQLPVSDRSALLLDSSYAGGLQRSDLTDYGLSGVLHDLSKTGHMLNAEGVDEVRVKACSGVGSQASEFGLDRAIALSQPLVADSMAVVVVPESPNEAYPAIGPTEDVAGVVTPAAGSGATGDTLTGSGAQVTPSIQDSLTGPTAESNDCLTQAIATRLTTNHPGRLTLDGLIGDNPLHAPELDVDMYTVQLDVGDRLIVDIDTPADSMLDSYLRLFDSTGVEVAASDDTAAPGEPLGLDSYLDFTAITSGNHFVAVSGFGNDSYNPFLLGDGNPGDTGTYRLMLDLHPSYVVAGTLGADTFVYPMPPPSDSGLSGSELLDTEQPDTEQPDSGLSGSEQPESTVLESEVLESDSSDSNATNSNATNAAVDVEFAEIEGLASNPVSSAFTDSNSAVDNIFDAGSSGLISSDSVEVGSDLPDWDVASWVWPEAISSNPNFADSNFTDSNFADSSLSDAESADFDTADSNITDAISTDSSSTDSSSTDADAGDVDSTDADSDAIGSDVAFADLNRAGSTTLPSADFLVISGNGNVEWGQGVYDTLDLSGFDYDDVTLDLAGLVGGGMVFNPGNGDRLFDVVTLSDGSQILFEGIDRLVFADQVIELSVVPNDPLFADQWNLHMMGLHNAWAFTTGTDDVLIGIQDTGLGVDAYDNIHPDLRPDATLMLSDNTPDEYSSRSFSHGTSVQSIIAAASDNGIGLSGINWTSEVMHIDVLSGNDVGDLYLAGATQQMLDEAQATGRKLVVNMSLSYSSSPEFETLIADYADDALFVISAGNSDTDMLNYPAVLADTYDNVIAVGASWGQVDANGDAATPGDRISYPGFWGSSYGEGLTLMGASEVIAAQAHDGSMGMGSTFGFALNTLTESPTNPFDNPFRGTSAAAPHVTGAASLVWSANPDLTAPEVSQILSETAYDLGTVGYDLEHGYGFVNADAAVRRALAFT